MRVGGFQDGVGECMEGQIGGKSGPGVFRTRQSENLGAWGEAWEGPGGGPKLLLRRSRWFWQGFPGHSLARFLVTKKQGNRLPQPGDPMTSRGRRIIVTITITIIIVIIIISINK